MKVINRRILTIVFIMIGVAKCFADDPDIPGDIPVEDKVPIDQYLLLLMVAGIILGFIMIYKKKIKKASI